MPTSLCIVNGNSLCAKSLQFYLTLWDLMDCTTPDSPVYAMLQAGILEQTATPSFRLSSCSRDLTQVSYVYLLWQVGYILLDFSCGADSKEYSYIRLDFPCGADSKEYSCNARDLGSFPGSGRFPVKKMATHSGILAWRIQWTEKPGVLQSIGSQRSQTLLRRLTFFTIPLPGKPILCSFFTIVSPSSIVLKQKMFIQ